LGTLADPSKEASDASPQEDTKKDNKEEEKPPSQRHVKFKFSSMQDSVPPYAGLYPSLVPFQVYPQTGAIPKSRTKQREENEEVSLKTTFRQLLLEDGNNYHSLLPLALSCSEGPLALPVILGPHGQ
jgi:hypothetical protein